MKTSHFLFFLAAVLLVYISGLFIDVMDVDASQYASMAREMLDNKSYLQVKERYNNYLDKPPMIFWLSSISFGIFGVSNVTYKLPSLIFSVIALFSAFRLARLYYNEQVARISVMITGSCQAFFLMSNDCRTDTILTGSIMLAVYHLAAYFHHGGKSHFIWGFFGIGMAMLTKGPVGFILPVLALGSDLLAKKQWKDIFRSEWLAGILIIAVMLLPMCIGLYKQFGSEGLKFYFWKQSFGRITGDNEFVKQLTESDYVNDPTFFYHTFLWAFLPWPILFITGLVFQFKHFRRNNFRILPGKEIITTAGFILTMVMMSNSQYKLPHYIFVAFPFAGILTARFLVEDLNGKLLKWLLPVHLFVMTGLWSVGFYLVAYSFSKGNLPFIIVGLILSGATVFVTLKSKSNKLLYMMLLSIISVNFLLNIHVYPRLLEYQPTSEIGRILKRDQVKPKSIYNYIPTSHSMDFYFRNIIPLHADANEKFINLHFLPGEYLILNKHFHDIIQLSKVKTELLYSGDQFQVSMVTPEFLNPVTRPSVVDQIFLIKVLP